MRGVTDEQLTLAKVYANAMIQLTETQAETDLLARELNEFATLVNENAELETFLASPTIDRDTRQTAIEKLFRGEYSDLFDSGSQQQRSLEPGASGGRGLFAGARRAARANTGLRANGDTAERGTAYQFEGCGSTLHGQGGRADRECRRFADRRTCRPGRRREVRRHRSDEIVTDRFGVARVRGARGVRRSGSRGRRAGLDVEMSKQKND